MRPARAVPESAGKRRSPTQRRSRERVRALLDAAAELILEGGVEQLTTRAVAERAGIPVASLYQYFADKEDVLLALVERDTAEMDAAVAEAVEGLREPGVRELVEAVVGAFVEVYVRRPAFVVLWCRGRTSPAVMEYCRAHNGRIARSLYDVATRRGVLRPGTDPSVVELAVEVGDRVFELAFSRDLRGDRRILAEGVELVAGYLERFAAVR